MPTSRLHSAQTMDPSACRTYRLTRSGQYSGGVPPAGGFATLCGMGMLGWRPAAAGDQFPATPGTSLPAIQTDSIVRLLPMSSAGFAV